MIANYHTHTRWCNHATGEIEDYVVEAIKKGLKEIAITEHVCIDMNSSRRLTWKKFEEFNKELDEVKEKYKNQIKVIKGFECEHYPHYLNKYKELKEKYNYELFILGQHENFTRDVDFFDIRSEEEVKLYADSIIEGIETGFYDIVVHPDVVLHSYEENEFSLGQINRIYEACEKHNVIVEVNANGYRSGRGYPSFKCLENSKKYKLKYIIGSDCHKVEHLVDDKLLELEKKVKAMDIVLIDTIDLNK